MADKRHDRNPTDAATEVSQQRASDDQLQQSPQLRQAIAMLAADHLRMVEMIGEEVAARAAYLRWDQPANATADPEIVGDVDHRGRMSLRPVGALRLSCDQPPAGDPSAETHWRAARWFVRAVEQRQRIVSTLLQLVARDGSAYFAGDSTRPPQMSRAEVAALFAMHVATIDELIGNKALRCRHGIIPLAQLIPAGTVDTGPRSR